MSGIEIGSNVDILSLENYSNHTDQETNKKIIIIDNQESISEEALIKITKKLTEEGYTIVSESELSENQLRSLTKHKMEELQTNCILEDNVFELKMRRDRERISIIEDNHYTKFDKDRKNFLRGKRR